MSGQEFTADHENGQPLPEYVMHTIGGIAMHETETLGVLIPEISIEREQCFIEKDPHATYCLLCSDDRHLTNESAAKLAELGVNADESVRSFGGGAGQSRALAVNICATGRGESLSAYRGRFGDFIHDSAQRMITANLIPCIHSAEKNEGNGDHLDSGSESGIGCAYLGNAETVTILNYSDDIAAQAADDIMGLSGRPAQHLEAIVEANKQVQEIFSNGGQLTFNTSRQQATDTKLPVGIQDGDHAKVDNTIVIVDFGVDKVSNPRLANDRGLPSYVANITQECEAILRANPDLELNPRILVESKILDIAATREALAAGEGKHAADLKLERRGDYEAAVAYLESLKASI